jgi:large subunit ribosomal protein L12
MEYVYAALLMHSAGKPVTEDTITAVLKAAGLTPDATRAKALVSALEGVNIAEVLQKAPLGLTPTQAPAAAAAPAADDKKKKEEEAKKDEKAEESGIEGLSALFG